MLAASSRGTCSSRALSGIDHRAVRDGHRAHLPVEPGHQLRGREHGCSRDRLFAVMAGKHGWPVLAFAACGARRRDAHRNRHRAGRDPPPVQGATRHRARRDHRRRATLPSRHARAPRIPNRVPANRLSTSLFGEWTPFADIDVSASQILVLVVVPLITVGLWWLLGHTAFGDAVRASATNADLARLTGINPKFVSSAVWSIAGFLSVVAVLLTASNAGTTDLIRIGPDTLLRGMAAALVGGMVSFPRAALGTIAIGVLERVLFFNSPARPDWCSSCCSWSCCCSSHASSKRDAEVGARLPVRPRIAAVPERCGRSGGAASAAVDRGAAIAIG